MSLLGFGMGTMLANFHMCGIMLVLRAVFNMLARNASPRGPMCFRCLMFNLLLLFAFQSGPSQSSIPALRPQVYSISPTVSLSLDELGN